MAELTIDPSEIAEALRKNVESYRPSVEREEVGRVVEAGDGIARVHGLPRAMARGSSCRRWSSAIRVSSRPNVATKR